MKRPSRGEIWTASLSPWGRVEDVLRVLLEL